MRQAKTTQHATPSMAIEFAGVEFGDERRTASLQRIAEACAAAPDQSFPEIARTPAELGTIYRFLESPWTSSAPIVKEHAQRTWSRAAECKLVLVPQDTSEFKYR